MNIYFLLSCNPIMLYLFYCLNRPSTYCGELCQLAPGPCEQMPVVMSLILALSALLHLLAPHCALGSLCQLPAKSRIGHSSKVLQFLLLENRVRTRDSHVR